MPSIEYHTKHSKTNKSDVHQVLDMPPLLPFDSKIHQKWRKYTHDPAAALLLGYAIDGKRGALDALQHIQDDRILTLLNKAKKTKNENKT